MAWEIPLNADIAWPMTRAEYDRNRTTAYRVTGVAPNNELLPDIGPGYPPGWYPRRTPWGGFKIGRLDFQGLYLFFDADLKVSESGSQPSWIPTRSRAAPFAIMDPGVRRGDIFRVSDRAVIGHVDDAGRVLRANGSVTDQIPYPNPGFPPERLPLTELKVYDPTWWYDSDFGREVVIFVPPAVQGQYGWEAAEFHTLPEDPTMQIVAVPWPHPYLTDLPAPLAIYRLGTGSMAGGGANPNTLAAIFRSPFIVTGRGDRQRPWRYPKPPDELLVAGAWPADAPGYLRGHYEDEETQEWWQEALDEATSVGIIIGGVVLTVASAGAFAPLLALATTAAAAKLGRGAVAEQAAAGISTYAKATTSLTVLGPVAQLSHLAVGELAIRSQQSQAAADELRLDLNARRAYLQDQGWFRAAQTAATVYFAVAAAYAGAATLAASAGAGAVTAGAGTVAAGLTQQIMKASTAALTLNNAAQSMRAQQREVEAAAEAESAALDAEIAHALAGAALPSAPPAPAEPPLAGAPTEPAAAAPRSTGRTVGIAFGVAAGLIGLAAVIAKYTKARRR
jgi:hypothetical protein